MNRIQLEELYKYHLLPESKNPYHFEKRENSSDEVKAYNPMCGDKFQLHLKMNDDTLIEGYFSGNGCAVSMASTSLLLQTIEGLPKKQILKECENFLTALDSGNLKKYKEVDKLLTLLELRNFDGRLDCIRLSWKALEDYLMNQ